MNNEENIKNITIDTDTHMIISKAEYQKLLDGCNKYISLESHGVDNWDGYCEAMEKFYNDDEDSYDY